MGMEMILLCMETDDFRLHLCCRVVSIGSYLVYLGLWVDNLKVASIAIGLKLLTYRLIY